MKHGCPDIKEHESVTTNDMPFMIRKKKRNQSQRTSVNFLGNSNTLSESIQPRTGDGRKDEKVGLLSRNFWSIQIEENQPWLRPWIFWLDVNILSGFSLGMTTKKATASCNFNASPWTSSNPFFLFRSYIFMTTIFLNVHLTSMIIWNLIQLLTMTKHAKGALVLPKIFHKLTLMDSPGGF